MKRAPCGCQMALVRPRRVALDEGGFVTDGRCQQSGNLYRVLLRQVEIGMKSRFNLVCGYHRAYMRRRDLIVDSKTECVGLYVAPVGR